MPTLEATTPQLTAVKNLIDAYCSLDMKNIEPHITKGYTFQSYPKLPELTDETMEGHVERFKALLSLFTKIDITYHEVIEAPGKVVIHGSTVVQTTGGEFYYHFIDIFTLAEQDGELRVVDYKDFCDPEKRANILGWAAKALAEGARAA